MLVTGEVEVFFNYAKPKAGELFDVVWLVRLNPILFPMLAFLGDSDKPGNNN